MSNQPLVAQVVGVGLYWYATSLGAGDLRQIAMAMVASLAYDVELNDFLFAINYIFPIDGANLLMLISGQPKS